MKVDRVKDGYNVTLTESEGRDIYSFMCIRKAMGNLDATAPLDALGLFIAVEVEKAIGKSKPGKDKKKP